jgi:hypothetical protein
LADIKERSPEKIELIMKNIEEVLSNLAEKYFLAKDSK